MVKPRNILMTIKQHDERNVTTMKSIYNGRQRYRIVEKASRSQMQQLMKQLNESKYVEWLRVTTQPTRLETCSRHILQL